MKDIKFNQDGTTVFSRTDVVASVVNNYINFVSAETDTAVEQAAKALTLATDIFRNDEDYISNVIALHIAHNIDDDALFAKALKYLKGIEPSSDTVADALTSVIEHTTKNEPMIYDVDRLNRSMEEIEARIDYISNTMSLAYDLDEIKQSVIKLSELGTLLGATDGK